MGRKDLESTIPQPPATGEVGATVAPEQTDPHSQPTLIGAGTTETVPTAPLSVPGYEILGELGRGGMGVVYRARQIRLNRIVALKMILAGEHAGEANLERFRAEAEAVARLQHPNVVQVYEIGEHEGKPYFSLEFCPGGSLESVLGDRPFPPRKAAELLATLARAMHAVHGQYVIHRDLKPANVLFAADGTPKITDFGLAKKTDEVSHTADGLVMGTPSYMAPEQADGKVHLVGPLSDVYSLGAVLYCLLTGRPPFQSANLLDVLVQVVSQDPVPPRRLNPSVPRDLETICLKCLQKDPARRYSSAQALADDLTRFLEDKPILARPTGPLWRAWRWCRRNPAVASLLALVALSLGLTLATMRASLARVEVMAQRNQVLLAESVATRLDERIRADRQAVELLSREPELRRFLLAEPGERGKLMPEVKISLDNVLASNANFSAAFVLDRTGTARASTNPLHLNRSYGDRDYFREASGGKSYLSRFRVGSSTNQPGAYYSAPIRDGNVILGVAVIKLEATSFWKVIEELEVGPDGHALLIDEDGVVVAHKDRTRLYHSLRPATSSELASRFRRESLPPLAVPALEGLVGVAGSGFLLYEEQDGSRRTVAYAPLTEKRWVLVLDAEAGRVSGLSRLLSWRLWVTVGGLACLLALAGLFLKGRWRPAAASNPRAS